MKPSKPPRSRISLEQIHYLIKRYDLWLLVILLAGLLYWGILVYYQHVYLVIAAQTHIGEEMFTAEESLLQEIQGVSINEETLQKVLDDIQRREQNLQRVHQKVYSSSFD